ncbi:MAG: MFS transporter [Nitrososphaerota archaeon]|nr:MFS transporter [Nitrososphaerota archaeon]
MPRAPNGPSPPSRALFTRNVALVSATRVLSSVGFSATMPFLALYLAVERGVSLDVVGAMYLLQAFASLGSQVLSGLVSDRVGAKRTYLLGYVFASASALYMAGLIIFGLPVVVIVATYPVFSLFRGFTIPAGAALVADEKTDVVTNFSLLTMAANLGFALGPAMGGILVAYTGYGPLFLFSAALSVVSLLASFFLEEGTYHLAKEKARVWPDRHTLTFILLSFVGYLVIGQDIEPFALYVGKFEGVSNLMVGYLFSFSGLMIVLLQIPLMRLLGRFRSHAVIVLSSGVSVLAFLMLYLSAGTLDLFASMAAMTLAEILLVVPAQVWVTLRAPPSRKGAYQGYYGAARSSGRSAAAWLGSTIQGGFLPAPGISWLVMAGVALATGVGFAFHGRSERTGAPAVGKDG